MNTQFRLAKQILPEYNGFEFWLTRLDDPTWEPAPRWGYNLRSAHHVEGGGSYDSRHEATCAAFARIETLTFDANH